MIILIRKGPSHALSTRVLANDLNNTESKHLELKRRIERKDLNDLISGTLTITIAPNATYGDYDGGKRRHIWESGLINHVFCHWETRQTTCLDRKEECDKSCLINGYSRRWWAIAFSYPPFIVEHVHLKRRFSLPNL